MVLVRIRFKNRILVQDRGGAESKTAGILFYVEDLKRGTNKDIEPKDIFEMDSSNDLGTYRLMVQGKSCLDADLVICG
jgi:hypothetical protein